MLLRHKHSFSAVALAIATLSGNAHALYDADSKTNLAMYWGQGPSQLDLLHYCQQPAVEIIPVGFIHVSPAEGNGYPGSNFGNKCGPGVFPAPGLNSANDQLLSNCPSINRDILICQENYGKKIILSLGGGTNTYSLEGEQAGRDFADFLWGAFGPQTAEWIDAGKPRPFDGPNGEEVQVDGFDMDIEYKAADGAAGYIALLRRLRELFATGNKEYIITGAPQCVIPDPSMAEMISAVAFDTIFVRFYNTPECSARNYITTGGVSSGFSFDQWSAFIEGTASQNAKLYIGSPGAPDAAGGNPLGTFWLNPSEAQALIEDFYDRDNFGGIMLWESIRAEAKIENGQTYYNNIKAILADVGDNYSFFDGRYRVIDGIDYHGNIPFNKRLKLLCHTIQQQWALLRIRIITHILYGDNGDDHSNSNKHLNIETLNIHPIPQQLHHPIICLTTTHRAPLLNRRLLRQRRNLRRQLLFPLRLVRDERPTLWYWVSADVWYMSWAALYFIARAFFHPRRPGSFVAAVIVCH